METSIKIFSGIVAFVMLEIFYNYAFERDTQNQLEIGAALDDDGMHISALAVRRKDHIVRTIALSYMLIISSMFTIFRTGISNLYLILSTVGAIVGFVSIFMTFTLKDYFYASEFNRNSYWGKLFLLISRIVAYIFTLVLLL